MFTEVGQQLVDVLRPDVDTDCKQSRLVIQTRYFMGLCL